MAKLKFGSILGYAGISFMFLLLRQQQTQNQVTDVISLLVKNYPGYQITNCSSINIIDDSKAYWYAYTSGKNIKSIEDIFIKLFGNSKCFDSLDYNSITSEFTYNLFLYSAAGSIKNSKIEEESLIKSLNELRLDFKKSGFDVSKWVQNPKDYIKLIIQKMESK